MSRTTENDLLRGVLGEIDKKDRGASQAFSRSSVYAVAAIEKLGGSDEELRLAVMFTHLWPLNALDLSGESIVNLQALAKDADLDDQTLLALRFMGLGMPLEKLKLIPEGHSSFTQEELFDKDRLTLEDMAATIMESFQFFLALQDLQDLDKALATVNNLLLREALRETAPLIQPVEG
jgi:hypothetical protein